MFQLRVRAPVLQQLHRQRDQRRYLQNILGQRHLRRPAPRVSDHDRGPPVLQQRPVGRGARPPRVQTPGAGQEQHLPGGDRGARVRGLQDHPRRSTS